MSLALGLTACEANQSPSMKVAVQNQIKWPVSAEKLLQADGFLSFAGLKMAKATPEQRHASARGRVNPNRTTGHFPYTSYLRREDMLAKSNFRQLNLAQADHGEEGFKLASVSTTKGVSGIPAPADKPNYNASMQLASAVDEPAAPVMAARPSDSGLRSAALQVAALIDRKIEEVLSANKEKVADESIDDADVAPTLEEQHAALSVVNMRMGDYEDKTRLVLDLSAAAKFDYDLNNVSSVLTVHINGAEWDLETKRYFDDHPLIQSYEVSKSESNDVTLQISLKHPSKMIMSGFVRPDHTRGHRIFFDVAAL